MNFLPPRKVKAAKIPKKRTKSRRTSAIKCRAHTNWVKATFDCLCKNASCFGPIDPHHVVTRGAGGGDEQVVPLCRHHHDAFHGMGRDSFEREYRKDLGATAAALWEQSPAGRAYRAALSRVSGPANPSSPLSAAEPIPSPTSGTETKTEE